MAKLSLIKRFKGYKPLCFLEESVLVSKKNDIYLFSFEGEKLEKLIHLDEHARSNFLHSFRLISRLFRYGFNASLPIDDGFVLCSKKNGLYKVDVSKKKISLVHKFRIGTHNLYLCKVKNIPGFNDSICYGEYFSNKGKSPVSIVGTFDGLLWKTFYQFPSGTINHIHSIVPDPYRQVVWILTGDFKNAAGFWMAKKNFQEVKPVLIGKQEYRACVAFPTEEGLIYGTDTQFEENSIRILKLKNGKWVSEYLYPLAGSCINACKINENYIFSSSVEPGKPSGNILLDLLETKPGPGIKGAYSEIIIGNPSKGFNKVMQKTKDIWPMRLFQFGTISFPSGFNSTNIMWAYGTALANYDDVTEIYLLEE